MPDDPNLWLEEVHGDRALAWVSARNEESQGAVGADPAFEALRARLLAIYQSEARIPYLNKRGDRYYNFWQDEANPRGLLRRTRLEDYCAGEPAWEIVLDLDALGREERESWVWAGAAWSRPGHRRCLIRLSRGGGDAVVVREFDVEARRFVEGGFTVPEAKTFISYLDADAVLVGTDEGPGSLTSSGYPRLVKRWRRGTPLADAELLFEGRPEDVMVTSWHDPTPGFERTFVSRMPGFFETEVYWVRGGDRVRIEKPPGAQVHVHREWVLFELREEWTHRGRLFPSGSLVVARFDDWLAGTGQLEALFEPTERASLAGVGFTRNHVLLELLDNVHTRVEVLTPGGGAWDRAPLDLGGEGTASVWAIDDEEDDRYFATLSGYLEPPSFRLGDLATGGPPVVLRSMPSFFDATGLAVSQHEAVSADGTRVPYFQVARADLRLDGDAPTILYGYGGFEVSLLPGYSAGVGVAWLEQGGVYVVANIRGGGEFGPRWHQSALKAHRHRAYEDFEAVGEHLITRGVTRPGRLGIWGGSNGGLLMGNMLTRRPELWGAVLCTVPLLDMQRYHLLLAGASWMDEYGDPDDPEQWSFLRSYSPYHNLSAGVVYPPVLFMTSTRDDRVHPGHARKMAARMLELGQEVLYWENLEGGHGGAADAPQRAVMDALGYRFLWTRLKAAP